MKLLQEEALPEPGSSSGSSAGGQSIYTRVSVLSVLLKGLPPQPTAVWDKLVQQLKVCWLAHVHCCSAQHQAGSMHVQHPAMQHCAEQLASLQRGSAVLAYVS